MEKPKAPVPASPLAAYQKVLAQKGAPPEEKKAPPSGGKSAGGLLKTGAAPPGALIKTGPPPKPRPPRAPAAEGDSKTRRVAKFLILIGSDEAAKILAQLERDQVEAISAEIALIRGIGPEESELILNEFRDLMAAPYRYTGASSGGIGAARRLLYAAFGPERGEALIRKTLPDAGDRYFDFLEDFSPEQLGLLFREESPAAQALVLSRLSPALSAGVLAKMAPERKAEIIRRIARLEQTGTEVLERVAAALREKARHLGRSGQEEPRLDGMNTLTAILKHSDLSFGDRILGELEDHDPDLGRDLKERLYTLEDLIHADDRPIQGKLRTLSDREIAVLLRGRSEAFTAKIFANLSAARGERVREEGELMGPVLKKEVEETAGKFLAWFRQGREEGRILLLTSEDVML